MTDHPDEPTQPWTILASRVAYRTPWFTVREDRVRTEASAELTYTFIERPGAVFVVPVLADGRIVMIRNYRYIVGAWCWEVPAGGMDGEPAEQAAARELREEIGGTATSLVTIGTFFMSNGTSTARATVVLACGVTLGTPDREPGELLRVVPLPAAEALRLARAGEVADGPSALALFLCERHLSGSSR